MAGEITYGENGQVVIKIDRKSGYTDSLVGSAIVLQSAPRINQLPFVDISRASGEIVVTSESEASLRAIANIASTDITNNVGQPAISQSWVMQVQVTPLGSQPQTLTDKLTINPAFPNV